jgi:hypothetical protein
MVLKPTLPGFSVAVALLIIFSQGVLPIALIPFAFFVSSLTITLSEKTIHCLFKSI